MTTYGRYDPTISPSPITGVFDTRVMPLELMPPETELIVMNDDQLMERPSDEWAVQNGQLVPYTPPPPVLTLAQQAQKMLTTGIAITSASSPSLDATYGCDDATYGKDTGILSGLTAGLTPPGGQIVRTDTTGAPHQFTADRFKALCQAKWNFIQELETIIGSNAGTLPAQPVEIG